MKSEKKAISFMKWKTAVNINRLKYSIVIIPDLNRVSAVETVTPEPDTAYIA